MEQLIGAGLGLDYEALQLSRTTEAWIAAGSKLRDDVADVLNGEVEAVEQIGSSSVVGLLAKPIVDLAVGLASQREVGEVLVRLEADDWIYRGDAGDEGGHVFVLEARPWHRVAHVHVVEHHGVQWSNYIRLRDLLRSSLEARDRYGAAKLELLRDLGSDRAAYTDAKSEVVQSLLDSIEQS